MNKKITILIILIILIGTPIFYYFIIFLPKNADREFQAEREYKCIELADNERARQEKESEVGERLTEFKYKYDKDSDSCLVYFRQLDNCSDSTNENRRTYETIRNLFNSEVVAEFSYRPSDFSYPDTTSLFNEFTNKVKQIFGE